GVALPRRLQFLDEEHDDRIGLLAGRTAGYPDAQRDVGLRTLDQWSNHVLLEKFPGLGVAEEVRDADQQIIGQSSSLGRIVDQQPCVVRDAIDVFQSHAAADATPERAPLVAAEV